MPLVVSWTVTSSGQPSSAPSTSSCVTGSSLPTSGHRCSSRRSSTVGVSRSFASSRSGGGVDGHGVMVGTAHGLGSPGPATSWSTSSTMTTGSSRRCRGVGCAAERLRHRAVFIAVALEHRAAARAPSQRGQGPLAEPLGRRRRRRGGGRRGLRRRGPAGAAARRSVSTPTRSRWATAPRRPLRRRRGRPHRPLLRRRPRRCDHVRRRRGRRGPLGRPGRARRAAGRRRRSCPTASPCCRRRSFSLPASCEHPWRVADRASGTTGDST